MPDTTQSTPMPTWAEAKADKNIGASVVNGVDMLVQESWTSTTAWEMVERQQDAFSLFNYGYGANERGLKYRMNRIDSTCIANAAVQVGDRPKVEFTATETGEKPSCYIDTRVLPDPTLQQPPNSALAQLMPQIRPECYAMGDGVMPQPLNEHEYALCKMQEEQAEAMRMQAQASGQPEPMGLVPKGLTIEVNDYMLAQSVTTLWEVKAEQQSHMSRYTVENVLYNGIFGYQFMFCDFDPLLKKHLFRNAEFLTVHVDPWRTDISTCQYVIFDQFMGADDAKAEYPGMADAIEKNATMGPPNLPGYVPYRVPLRWMQSFMGRKMVIVRTAWLRNQPFPMTPADALADGSVVQAPKQATPTATTPAKKPGLIAKLKSMVGMGDKETPNEDRAEGSTDTASVDADGVVGLAGGPPAGADDLPDAPLGYYLPADDGTPDLDAGEVDPSHPDWPTRLGIREIRILAMQVISDEECARSDIPVGHNVNIPIPFTPFGKGDPERLAPLQRAFDQTLNSIVEGGDNATDPAKIVPESLSTANPSLMKNGFVTKRVYTLPDNKFVQFSGKPFAMVDAPATPPDQWKRYQLLDAAFDKQSGQGEILQGSTPSNEPLSGTAIGKLQAHAKSSINFKAGRTVDMLEYLARIMVHDWVFNMSPEDLAKDVRKYPVEVWAELHRRLIDHSESLGINIKIAASEADRAGTTAAMVQSRGTPVPWSDETIMSRMGGDAETELMNNAKAARRAAQMQQQAPGGAQMVAGNGTMPNEATGAPAAPQQTQSPEPAYG